MQLKLCLLILSALLGLCWGFRFDALRLPLENVSLLPQEDVHCLYATLCFPKGTSTSTVQANIGKPDSISSTDSDENADQYWIYSELRIVLQIKRGRVQSAFSTHFN